MSRRSIYILFLFLLIWIKPTRLELEIKEHGIRKMMRGDVGMVFFITIENIGKKPYKVDVKMIQCMEIYSEDEYDAESMNLLGGHMGIIPQNSKKTVTLIYPNMVCLLIKIIRHFVHFETNNNLCHYLYNRRGICTIGIYYTDEKLKVREIQAKVKFSTVPTDGNVPDQIKDFYENRKFQECKSVDLDPFRNCEPVDCMMKYSGAKSYYNRKLMRCQKVPRCSSAGKSAYIPTSNKCRSLVSTITESELNLIDKKFVVEYSTQLPYKFGIIFNCYHGKLDENTGLCVCDEGWTSADIDIKKYLPGLSHYHMCNIEINSWTAANREKIRNTVFAFAILAVVITMSVFMITFCLHALQLYLKDYEGISPFELTDDEDNEVDEDE